MLYNESRPKAAPESFRGDNTESTCSAPLRCALDALDYAHAGDSIAFDRGRSQGQLETSIDLACQWLLNLAVDDQYIATGVARSRHGDGWADLIARQASGVDW